MTVKEAINMLSYGTAYELKGAYSGKIYHRSYANSNKNLDKYADREVTDSPLFAKLVMRGSETNMWYLPVVGIWMHDYDIARAKG